MKKEEWPLLAAIFFDLFGFGMLIPDIQLRAEKVIPPGWPVGLTIGLMLASTFIIQAVVSPFSGRLSDAVGRKPIFILCCVLSAVGMIVYGFAGTIVALFASRIISGFGAANVAIGQAMMSGMWDQAKDSDQKSDSMKAAAMGRMGAALSAGLIMGPAVGGQLAHNQVLLGSLAGFLSLVGALSVAIFVPFTAGTGKLKEGTKKPKGNIALLVEFPQIRGIVLIVVVAWFSLATLEGTFGRLINREYGYGPEEFGNLFAFESFLSVMIQAFLIGKIAARFNSVQVLRVGYLLQGVGLALNPYAAVGGMSPMILLVLASLLFAVGAGIAGPTIYKLYAELTPVNRHGEMFGLLQSARSLGFVIGPILGGNLFDLNPRAPYLLAGAVCILAAFLVPPLRPVNQLGTEVPGRPNDENTQN